MSSACVFSDRSALSGAPIVFTLLDAMPFQPLGLSLPGAGGGGAAYIAWPESGVFGGSCPASRRRFTLEGDPSLRLAWGVVVVAKRQACLI